MYLYKFAQSFRRCSASSSPSACRRQRKNWRLAFPSDPLEPACQDGALYVTYSLRELLLPWKVSFSEKRASVQHALCGICDLVTLLLLQAMRSSPLGGGQLARGLNSLQTLQCFSAT